MVSFWPDKSSAMMAIKTTLMSVEMIVPTPAVGMVSFTSALKHAMTEMPLIQMGASVAAHCPPAAMESSRRARRLMMVIDRMMTPVGITVHGLAVATES